MNEVTGPCKACGEAGYEARTGAERAGQAAGAKRTEGDLIGDRDRGWEDRVGGRWAGRGRGHWKVSYKIIRKDKSWCQKV